MEGSCEERPEPEYGVTRSARKPVEVTDLLERSVYGPPSALSHNPVDYLKDMVAGQRAAFGYGPSC
ncbi:hypothetical protein [Methylacidiphilum kamchatkense]|uniref:hypothetical protein n=1 Tax=Methylacidiphilum kamchatkense TaxID=431057 RepID=UPI000AAF0045|nr:hypothetical protein [Methylacidiphilum kamchatkense]